MKCSDMTFSGKPDSAGFLWARITPFGMHTCHVCQDMYIFGRDSMPKLEPYTTYGHSGISVLGGVSLYVFCVHHVLITPEED